MALDVRFEMSFPVEKKKLHKLLFEKKKYYYIIILYFTICLQIQLKMPK